MRNRRERNRPGEHADPAIVPPGRRRTSATRGSRPRRRSRPPRRRVIQPTTSRSPGPSGRRTRGPRRAPARRPSAAAGRAVRRSRRRRRPGRRRSRGARDRAGTEHEHTLAHPRARRSDAVHGHRERLRERRGRVVDACGIAKAVSGVEPDCFGEAAPAPSCRSSGPTDRGGSRCCGVRPTGPARGDALDRDAGRRAAAASRPSPTSATSL